MAKRFAILDVPRGNENQQLDKRMEAFQDTVTRYFSYGAAYYPWLNTSVVSDRDVTGDMFNWTDAALFLIDKLASNDDVLFRIISSYFPSKIVLEKNKKEEQTENDYTFSFGYWKEKSIDKSKGYIELKKGKNDSEKPIGKVIKICNMNKPRVIQIIDVVSNAIAGNRIDEDFIRVVFTEK